MAGRKNTESRDRRVVGAWHGRWASATEVKAGENGRVMQETSHRAQGQEGFRGTGKSPNSLGQAEGPKN